MVCSGQPHQEIPSPSGGSRPADFMSCPLSIWWLRGWDTRLKTGEKRTCCRVFWPPSLTRPPRNDDEQERTMRTLRRIIAVAIFFTLAATGWAQWSEAERTVVRIEHDYEVDPNITYRVANNYEAKLDVYRPQEAKTPVLVMYIHGGGWLAGTKEEAVLN